MDARYELFRFSFLNTLDSVLAFFTQLIVYSSNQACIILPFRGRKGGVWGCGFLEGFFVVVLFPAVGEEVSRITSPELLDSFLFCNFFLCLTLLSFSPF